MATTWIFLPAAGTSTGGGDATAAKQDIGNAYLASIDSKIPSDLTVTNGKLEVSADVSFGTSNVEFDEITSVPSGIETDIISYVAGTNEKLVKVIVAGTNIAKYEVRLNGSPIARKYSYFGGALNVDFDLAAGLSIVMGDTITVSVIHDRTDLGDFNASLLLQEI